MKKVLFVQTSSFTDNGSGVPRVTYNLGKYFTQKGLKIAYFSFKTSGHIDVVYGHLYHAMEEGNVNNKSNLIELQNSIADFLPHVVINQMPYKRNLRKLLGEQSSIHNFKLIGCIHNSLFTFKNNVKSIMKRELPKPLNYFMANEVMIKIPMLYHFIKQKIELTDMLSIHDILLLFTPANYKELEFFLNPDNTKDAKVGIMPNPVLDIQKKVPKKDKIILHLGRLNIPQKRSDLLLDFWENVYEYLPDWQFKIVGNGEYHENLIQDLAKRKLPRVELLGFQKPEKYYQEASIFMMPSAYEGLANTILEAQSFACPIIAFDSYAALRWIVKDNENALLAKPFDTKDLAQKCIYLAKDEKLLREMQKSALSNVQKYHIDKVGKMWENLFCDLSKTTN